MHTDATPDPAAPISLALQLSASDARRADPGFLTVKVASAAGQQSLPLAATLSGGGVIYCSSPADPLAHTLELTLKNTSQNGAIFTAGTQVASPQIMVSFVYGTTAGALAPVTWKGLTPPGDSAFNIKAVYPVRRYGNTRLDSGVSAGTQMAVRYVRRL
jgi:hypothetical protein